MAVVNLKIYYTQKNIKCAYKNNRFKISAPAWNDKFDSTDGSYSIAQIQNCFGYIIEKHEPIAYNPLEQIFISRIKNSIVFKIQIQSYKLELFPETIKLLGSAKQKTLLKIKANNMYQNQNKLKLFQYIVIWLITTINKRIKVLFKFGPNKQFEQLISVSPHSLTMLNTTNTALSFIKIWFSVQNSKQLEIEDSVNMTLIIG